MAKYYHCNQEQQDCDWLTDYAYIPYEEYDIERKRLILKNRDIKNVSDCNIYALLNMSFYPIEELILRNLEKEKTIKNERQKLEEMQKFIKKIQNK